MKRGRNSCQEIIFFSKKETAMTQLKKKISKLMLFDNFRETLESEEDFKEAVPSIASVEEGVSLYENIPDELEITKQQARSFGIILIKFD